MNGDLGFEDILSYPSLASWLSKYIFRPRVLNKLAESWHIYKVAKAVANNELGTAAKIATNDGDTKKGRLICVYTKHFGEVEDIARVAKRMQELGLIAKVQQGRAMIHYKPGEYITSLRMIREMVIWGES